MMKKGRNYLRIFFVSIQLVNSISTAKESFETVMGVKKRKVIHRFAPWQLLYSKMIDDSYLNVFQLLSGNIE